MGLVEAETDGKSSENGSERLKEEDASFYLTVDPWPTLLGGEVVHAMHKSWGAHADERVEDEGIEEQWEKSADFNTMLSFVVFHRLLLKCCFFPLFYMCYTCSRPLLLSSTLMCSLSAVCSQIRFTSPVVPAWCI